MGFIIKTKKFRRLDLDTTYEIKVRVKWGDRVGEWTDPPVQYTTLNEDSIPPPLNVSMDFKKEKNDRKWSCIARCDEVTLPDCDEGVDEYIFQLWKWDPKTNTLKEDDYFLKERVKARDDDKNDFATAKFYPVPKKAWYVCRARAVVDGVKGEWSDFSGPGSPSDREPPPQPTAVAIHRAPNGIRFTWETPSEFDVLNGTVTCTSGTSTLTGTGTNFDTEVGDGTYIRVGQETATVDVVSSATSLTIFGTWAESHTDEFIEVDNTEDIIDHADVEMYTEDPDNPDQFFRHAFLEERDRRVFQSRIRFKAEGNDPRYGRVRLVDSSGVKSEWVPATRAGNNDPDADPETRKPKNPEQMAVFTVNGNLTAKSYGHRWYAEHDYAIKSVRTSLGTAGSSQTKVQIYRNGDAIFANPNRPTVNSGDHRDIKRNNDIREAYDTIDDDQYFTISVDEAGSGAKDMVVQIRMERDN